MLKNLFFKNNLVFYFKKSSHLLLKMIFLSKNQTQKKYKKNDSIFLRLNAAAAKIGLNLSP